MKLMSTVLALLAVMTFGGRMYESPSAVRVGLFSLFKPRTLEIRVVSGAIDLAAEGIPGDKPLTNGDVVNIQAFAGRLQIGLVSAHGVRSRDFSAGGARFSSSGPASFELSVPGKIKRLFSGELSVSNRSPENALKIVLTTSRESAVSSVVAAELKGEHSAEALKALAIVVRTFIAAHIGRHSDEGFDFCDTTHCQLYRGEDDLASDDSNAAGDAARSTSGMLLTFRGRAIDGFYTAACGGLAATPQMVWGGANSENGYPYRRLSCQWCRGSRYYRWKRSATARAILTALSEATGLRLSESTVVHTIGSDGFVANVILKDGERRRVMKVDEFRRAIGQRLGWNTVLSPSFVTRRQGSRFVFSGRGFGSQVGLCVAGAREQARAGWDYTRILSFYYPEARVSVEATEND
jgi:stage II sporulation protein D (peptidoglycan lytic transglycosylase)